MNLRLHPDDGGRLIRNSSIFYLPLLKEVPPQNLYLFVFFHLHIPFKNYTNMNLTKRIEGGTCVSYII